MPRAANSEAEPLVRFHVLGPRRGRLFAGLVLVVGLFPLLPASPDARLVVSHVAARTFIVVSDRFPVSKGTSAHPERFVRTQIERVGPNGNAKRLAPLPKRVRTVVFSPDHRKAALMFRGWLEVMRIDGGARHRIARIWVKSEPAWSPDGHRLAFSFGGHIYSVTVDGGDKRQLTNTRRWDDTPKWSPSGKQIAFVRWQQGPGSAPGLGTVHHWDHAGGRVWVMRPDGTHERKLKPFANSPADLVWSSDGKEIAASDSLVESGDPDPVWLLSVDGRSVRRIAGTLHMTERGRPVWAPRGSSIAVVNGSVLNIIDGRNGQILVRLDLPDLVRSPGALAWSSDGSSLAVAGCSFAGLQGPPYYTGPCGVYVVNGANGTATKPIALPGDIISVKNITWTQ